MTLDEYCLAVSIKAGMNNDPGSEDRLRMEAWANEGVERVLMETHVYVDTGTADLAAGETRYRLDDAILAILSRELTSTAGLYSLRQADLETVQDVLRRNAVGLSAYFALVGHDMLVVAPPPASGDEISFTYVPKPARMTTGANDSESVIYGGIPSWGSKAVEYYMLWQAAERNDKERGLNVDKAYAMFEAECGVVRKRMRQKSGRGLPRAKIGYPERRTGRRNDVYYSGS